MNRPDKHAKALFPFSRVLVCASLGLSACAGSRKIPLQDSSDFIRKADGGNAYCIALKNGEVFVSQSLRAHGDSLTFAKAGLGSGDTSVLRQDIADLRYEGESRVIDRLVTATACTLAGILATAVVFLTVALQAGRLGGC